MITRFAPSPTGHLHLGHVVNAILVWERAREAAGIVRLRIEDHDRQRCRPEFERSILDDLDWLGFVPDVPSTDAFRAGPCDGRQSDHPERYQSALARLSEAGLVYGCDCSRADIARRAAVSRPPAPDPDSPKGDIELRYDGFCRRRGLTPGAGVGARVRIDRGVEAFDDAALGVQRQEPAAQCGDLLVRDRAGLWTYQFAVAVDDMAEAITDVIRGRDLLASTGRQIRLARLLGRDAPPRFLHHPLIVEGGRKLSKARGDTGIGQLRRAGVRPQAVLEQARRLAGLPA